MISFCQPNSPQLGILSEILTWQAPALDEPEEGVHRRVEDWPGISLVRNVLASRAKLQLTVG